MNRLEHLLTIAAEECAEVAQRISKALRFGLAEIQPEQPFNNAERIAEEVADLFAVLQMIEAEADVTLLPGVTLTTYDHSASEALEAKRRKVERFLSLSQTCGTLSEEP